MVLTVKESQGKKWFFVHFPWKSWKLCECQKIEINAREFFYENQREIPFLEKFSWFFFCTFSFSQLFLASTPFFFVVFDFNSFHLLKSLMDLLIFVLKASCLEKVYTSKYFALCYMFAGLSLCNEIWNWIFFLFSIVSFVVHKIVIFVIFV